MPKTIWKYPITVTDQFSLEMPKESRILKVDIQGSSPQLWAVVDPDNARENRRFFLVGTGHPLDDDLYNLSEYIGTFQLYSNNIVLHLFEVLDLVAAMVKTIKTGW